MMSEHQKHTEFLRESIRYDESARRQELMEEIGRIQRDARCVRRAVWLMAILIALAAFGLGYGVVLGNNFPYNIPQFIINTFCVLVVSWLISILAFAGLGLVYRWKLDRRREECRQMVRRILESRLGKTVTTPWRDNRDDEEDDRAGRVASEVNDSLVKIESATQG
jgi:uncharacterized membrane protein YccC